MLMTHAQTRPSYRPHSLDFLALDHTQRAAAAHTLADLGIDTDGTALTDTDGNPDPAFRTLISAVTASELGMSLTAGHELALCHDCLTLGDAQDMCQGPDGAWRCAEPDPHGYACHTAYAAAYELDQ